MDIIYPMIFFENVNDLANVRLDFTRVNSTKTFNI